MGNGKQAIIFDYGGTLDTDGIHWSEKFWETYTHFRIPVSKEEFRGAFVYAERKITNVIKPDFILKQTFRTQIKYQMEYLQTKFFLPDVYGVIVDELAEYCYRSVIQTVEISKGILELLAHNYSLGLVSNYYGNVKTVLRELSLKKYFNSIIDSAVVGIRKPDLRIFQLSLNDLSVTAGQAIVVGDSYENDIIPGKLIGCKTIWIKGKSWKDHLQSDCADLIINSIKELPDAIQRLEHYETANKNILDT